ncbi:hypothetical protein, partial [Glaesserella parasuis]|uniref:hypothetical protein n=1 Tax=Glaesserella parasuis TaxID=738 RepID=UPI003B7C69E2
IYDENSSKTGYRRDLPQHSKGHIDKVTANIILKLGLLSVDTRVSTFTTIIQHTSGSPSYSNQRRKRNKRNPDQKRRSKALFADDMILYIKNSKDSIRKLL